ncbi:hypothetical protein [Fulvivirga ligni]|uniref:hypothetical protein n=1 Tax=Fulvivirga ligni TaxID=2904246 RepID=UPI001F4607DD|nr:hypothetical protein [Fulvivirga ligni]UII22322.1 hypothetical protein LVD16_03645 [Fulvivirga ligni]
MGYYTRVFCTTKKKPTVSQILQNLKLNGFNASSNLSEPELMSDDWTHFELFYKEGKLPILVEVNEIEASDGLAEEEIEEFKEAIGKPGWFDSKKKKVLKHLSKTSFILCNQLPTSDIDDDDGYAINGELMDFFRRECEGMIQCDAEGFYSEGKLILEE